jgi:phosphoribosylglycinamide formyltransferase-1
VAFNRLFRLGVLGSGRGTNLSAIAQACATEQIPAAISLVLSDSADAGILQRASELGLTSRYLPPGPFRTKLDEPAEAAYAQALLQAQVDVVILAGFMRVLRSGLLGAFPRRVLNIHPSLLPAFPGLQAWRQALVHGVKITGCTVHFVDQGVDTGPIVAQRAVPVLDDDTPESLHARIQEAEHELYPTAIGIVVSDGYRIDGRRVCGLGRRAGG